MNRNRCLRLQTMPMGAKSGHRNRHRPLPSCGWAVVAALLLGLSAQAQLSADASLVAGREAILSRNYSKAIQILRAASERYPHDTRLKLELGQAYVCRGDLRDAENLFRSLLAADPSDRNSKLELAHALRRRRQLAEADGLYRELLRRNPSDEPAAIGLASNLIRENKLTEARQVLNSALAAHPNSLRLQEYSDRLDKGEMNLREVEEDGTFGESGGEPLRGETLDSTSEYFGDSSGNHIWAFRQALDARATPRFRNYLKTEERLFHSPIEPNQLVFTVGDELRAQVNEWLALVGGGGAVRFDDGKLDGTCRAGLEIQPVRRLLVSAEFLRNPVYPNGEAAEFRVMAQGVGTYFKWQPGPWTFNAWWNRQDYSDANTSNRGSGEVLRSFRAEKFLFEAGYRLTAYSFQSDTEHGYYSPDLYRSHLGVLGTQLQVGKHFRAEWAGRLGAESIGGGKPFHTAWESSLSGELRLGNWEIVPHYAYYHLVQASGAFRANVGIVTIRYRF